MEFPKEDEIIEGFKVISIDITHIADYSDGLARYSYPTEIIVESLGSFQDVRDTFSKWFDKEKTIYSGYGNPYKTNTGAMKIEELKNNRYKITAIGTAIRETKTFDNLEEKAIQIYNSIFGGETSVTIDGVTHSIELTPRAKVKRAMINGLSFLEQNPKKTSKWAVMAREGHRIMWVMKGRSYIAQVRDDVFYDFRKK